MNQRQANIINILANSTLLPGHVSEPILSDNPPLLTEIIDQFLMHALDCEATVAGDSKATMNERRVARAVAAVAFLEALANE